jgi:hypothetical protein
MQTFQKDISELQRIVAEAAILQKHYVQTFQKARENLFDLLRTSPIEINGEFPYSRWMESYFKLESQFFAETPQNPKLGANLETAVKHVIKSRFPDHIPQDFVESKKQYPYPRGRMEIAIKTGNQMTFVQVKRGFYGSSDWTRILQEKESIEQMGNRYLLLSPTEYTNKGIRKEIREKHLWKWCFIWKENCWKGEPCPDWMERFLDKIDK